MINIQKILYPTDFSSYSNQAYFHAVALAEEIESHSDPEVADRGAVGARDHRPVRGVRVRQVLPLVDERDGEIQRDLHAVEERERACDLPGFKVSSAGF